MKPPRYCIHRGFSFTAAHLTTSVLVCALLLLVTPFQMAQAQDEVSNRGTDFLMTFLPNFDSSVTIELHLTGAATTVTIEYPANDPTFTETVTIVPDEVTIVEMPDATATGWTANEVQSNAVRATADDPFVAYMINRRDFSSDAALALPVESMNVEYFTTHYPSSIVSQDRAEFAIVAPFDDTEVTITPTAPMGSTGAGETLDIVLNSNETFLGVANTSNTAGDLTGTRIESSRPIGVTSGNRCTNIPSSSGFCDHIFKVNHPIQTWGASIPVANLPNRPTGSVYRILASEDATEVQANGTVIATLDRGEFFEVEETADDQVFSGSNPIFVTQFMTGSSRPGTGGVGDPAMGAMIPSDQYLSNYTFSTVGGAQFAEDFLTVIASNEDIGSTLTLDGSVVDASEFSAIAGTDLSVARIALTSGSHTTSSANPHGITVQGYNDDDSYLYPGGARFEFIAPGEDNVPPVCEFVVSNGIADGTITDDGPDDSGIFFVRLSEDADNVELNVDPFTPGDPVATYQLVQVDSSLPGSGTVTGIDGSGNSCQSVITFSGEDECAPPTIAETVNRDARTITIEVTDPEGISSAGFVDPDGNTVLVNLTASLVSGALETTDGINWTAIDPANPPTAATFELAVDEGATMSQHFITVENGCGTSLSVDPIHDMPSDAAFAVKGGYPNPFAGQTTIEFVLSEPDVVRIDVFNALGQQVTALRSDYMGAGNHEVQWDGTDSSGRALAPGVYFVRINTSAGSGTARLIKR